MTGNNLGIGAIDEETIAMIRAYNPQTKPPLRTLDEEGNSHRLRLDKTADALRGFHNPAHHKTFEERYHARTYQELRGI
jgi:hypothetical protein